MDDHMSAADALIRRLLGMDAVSYFFLQFGTLLSVTDASLLTADDESYSLQVKGHW